MVFFPTYGWSRVHPLIRASLSQSRVTDDSFPKRATAHRYTSVHLLDAICKFSCLLAGHRQTVGNMNHAAMRGRCLITGNPSPCAILQIQTKPNAFPFIPPFSFFIDRIPRARRKPPGFRNVGINIEYERISINNFNNVKKESFSLSSSLPSPLFFGL